MPHHDQDAPSPESRGRRVAERNTPPARRIDRWERWLRRVLGEIRIDDGDRLGPMPPRVPRPPRAPRRKRRLLP